MTHVAVLSVPSFPHIGLLSYRVFIEGIYNRGGCCLYISEGGVFKYLLV